MRDIGGLLGTNRAVYGPSDRMAYTREKLPCQRTTSEPAIGFGRAPRGLFRKARSVSFNIRPAPQRISTKCGLMATLMVGSCMHATWSGSLVCPSPTVETH